MKRNRAIAILVLLGALAAAACGGQAPAPTVDVDAAVQTAIAATRAFEEQMEGGIQATLTAIAQAATNASLVPPTATPEPPASTPLADTPAAPTNTPQLPTATAPPTTPAPTPTPLRIGESDTDGNDPNDFLRGSSNSNNGRVVLLPGFNQADVEDTPTFRDFINFRVEIFDTRAGLYDGAGIEKVIFRIFTDDDADDLVWEWEDAGPAFCAFGGDDPGCTAINLRAGAQWPAPFAGEIKNNVYLARIDIIPEQGDETQWRWRFFIDSPNLTAAAPEPAPNTARINSIRVQDGRYVVDFEAFGFTPQLPGQHLHFFFDSVPPDQAGAPGSGPWQLYPAAAGQPGTSPFTLLTVASRPPNANQMCILVANPDHSVIQGTGNCANLP